MQMQIWAVFLSANFLQAAYFLQVSLYPTFWLLHFVAEVGNQAKLNQRDLPRDLRY